MAATLLILAAVLATSICRGAAVSDTVRLRRPLQAAATAPVETNVGNSTSTLAPVASLRASVAPVLRAGSAGLAPEQAAANRSAINTLSSYSGSDCFDTDCSYRQPSAASCSVYDPSGRYNYFVGNSFSCGNGPQYFQCCQEMCTPGYDFCAKGFCCPGVGVGGNRIDCYLCNGCSGSNVPKCQRDLGCVSPPPQSPPPNLSQGVC